MMVLDLSYLSNFFVCIAPPLKFAVMAKGKKHCKQASAQSPLLPLSPQAATVLNQHFLTATTAVFFLGMCSITWGHIKPDYGLTIWTDSPLWEPAVSRKSNKMNLYHQQTHWLDAKASTNYQALTRLPNSTYSAQSYREKIP